MEILIVGSMSHLTSTAEQESFKSACQELGRALVRDGHTLVVGSRYELMADCHVVKGAEAIPDPHKVVQITPYDAEMFHREEFRNIAFEFHPPSNEVGDEKWTPSTEGFSIPSGGIHDGEVTPAGLHQRVPPAGRRDDYS